jgi:hypothetical protein
MAGVHQYTHKNLPVLTQRKTSNRIAATALAVASLLLTTPAATARMLLDMDKERIWNEENHR